MAAQFVFPALVNEHGIGCIDPEHKPRYRSTLQQLAGKRIEFVIRKPKSKRSLDMNNYLHSTNGPFRLLAEYFGEDLAGIKYALAGQCFGWAYSKAFDRDIPVKPHSSDWTVEDSKYFVDWVIPWAAREHGVLIPLPGEVL
jgi:hypothetical protein